MHEFDKQRVILATIVAPLVPGIFFVVIKIIDSNPGWTAAGLVFFFSTLFGYIGIFLIGLPLTKLLRYLGILNLPFLVLGGAVGGSIILYLFIIMLEILLKSHGTFGIEQIKFGAGVGATVALCFGIIAGITIRSSGHAKDRRST